MSNSVLKFISAPVLAVSLALCGCGDGDSASPSKRAGNSSFKPMAEKNAAFVCGVNLDKGQLFKIADSYFDMFCSAGFVTGDKLEEMTKKFESFKKDPFAEAPAPFRSFLDKSGLRDAEIYWAVLSLSDFSTKNGEPQFGGLSAAVAGTVDLSGLIASIEKEADGEVVFEAADVEGEKAFHIVAQSGSDRRGMERMGIDPYVVSLGGKLVIAAYSKDALSRQIRLYRDGKNRGNALAGFSAAEGELMHLRIDGLGDLIGGNVPERELKGLNMLIPDGAKIAKELKSLEIDGKVMGSGKLECSAVLKTGSPQDAETLRTLAAAGLTAGRAQTAQLNAKFARTLDAVEIGGSGDTFEVRNLDFILISMAAVVPNIVNASAKANASVVAMQGAKIVMGIITENIGRDAGCRGSLWPRTKTEEDSDPDDIAGRAFDSAAAYFEALFDIEAYARGKDNWRPYVDVPFESLGKTAVKNGRISAEGLDWCIAANVTEDMPDFIPVLITANFNPSQLLDKWDGTTDAGKVLDVGIRSGAAKSMFGDRQVVIVRKDGAVERIDAGKLTYSKLYRRQAFDLSDAETPLMYLTPYSAVKPVGRCVK